jgi:hypothetical protein
VLRSIKASWSDLEGLVKLAVDSEEYSIRVLIRKITAEGGGVGNL